MTDAERPQEAEPLPWGVLVGGVILLGILGVGAFTAGGGSAEAADPTLELLAAQVDASSGLAGQVGAQEIPGAVVPAAPDGAGTSTAQDAKEGCLSFLEDRGAGVAPPNFANWSAREDDGRWEVAGNVWLDGDEDSRRSFTCEIAGTPGTWSLVSLTQADG